MEVGRENGSNRRARSDRLPDGDRSNPRPPDFASPRARQDGRIERDRRSKGVQAVDEAGTLMRRVVQNGKVQPFQPLSPPMDYHNLYLSHSLYLYKTEALDRAFAPRIRF